MKIPDMDRQTEQDILEKITMLSKAYVPEWHFDREKPDIGTALLLLYAGMHENTLKKMERLLKKNMLEFFTCAGASLLGASPAKGFVVFDLVNSQADGILVKKQTKLIAENEMNEDSSTVFETVNDVYVTPALLLDLFQIHPRHDSIHHIYHYNIEDTSLNFRLFQPKGEDLQRHELYLSHNTAFFMNKPCCIRILFQIPRNGSLSREFIQSVKDSRLMICEYKTEDGYEAFQSVEAENNLLCLYKEENQPPSAKAVVHGEEGYWIRIRILSVEIAASLCIEGLGISNQGKDICPDFIFSEGMEQEKEEYLPFGEQMGEYEEVYFGSTQVFCQKGSKITLSFRMNFMKIPTDTYGKQEKAQWKLIMKKSDFTPDPEYDIGVYRVIWEYFNGNGWRKLPESSRYESIFSPMEGTMGSIVEAVFSCPWDMEPAMVYSGYSHFIRARIIKMSNAFKANGRYITPVLSHTRLSFQYGDNWLIPNHMAVINNINCRLYGERDLKNLNHAMFLFESVKEETDTLYMGFDKPFTEGPVRLLIQLKENCEEMEEPLFFEYYGNHKWKSMNMIDKTRGFLKTGILTFSGNPDAQERVMWGKSRYWIRISKGRKPKNGLDWPVITHIYINATEILAVDTKEPEVFFIEPNEKNARFRLTGKNIYKMHVWVKEARDLSSQELSNLEKDYPVKIKETENGTGREIWVEWKEVKNFSHSKALDYHYMADKSQGSFWFSDGIKGKIPDSGTTDTILVEYQCGSGREGNLPVGAVNRLNSSIGYINGVKNPEICAGGMDREDVERAVNRVSNSFRHRNRAVSAKDYEALALESVRNIARVKCYSNCGADGKKQPGHIALVVLLENHYEGRRFFSDVRKEMLDYFSSRAPGQLINRGCLHILEPEFIEIGIIARIKAQNVNEIFRLRQEIYQYLDKFLDPIKGNFYSQGWEIGEIPNSIQLKNAIARIPSVTEVAGFRVEAAVIQNGVKREIDIQGFESFPFAVLASAGHVIEIVL